MVLTSDEVVRTRTTLIKRLKDWKDEASWQDFFDTYWKLIYGIALKSGLSETEAQEVVQETMISVAKHMPTFVYDRSIGSFKAWLLNMTRWRITDQLRKRRRWANLAPLPSETEIGPNPVEKLADPMSVNLDAYWDIEWERNLLDIAFSKVKRRLDPQKYQIFDCYVNKEWAPTKVAQAFNISVEQVYLAKYRVTEMVKEEIKRLKTAVV